MIYPEFDQEKITTVVEQLNLLLADYNLYYQKLRNFHWNVSGEHFFTLHVQFEDMYEDAKTKVDNIAERILTLRHHPTSNFSDYLKISHIEESPSELDGKKMVATLLSDHDKLLNQLAEVARAAENAGDEGTVDMVGAYIGELEKTSWMLSAWAK